MFFILKYIKIIFIFLKKLFLISFIEMNGKYPKKKKFKITKKN